MSGGGRWIAPPAGGFGHELELVLRVAHEARSLDTRPGHLVQQPAVGRHLLRAPGAHLAVDDNKRDTAPTQPRRLVTVRAHAVGVLVAREDLADSPPVQPDQL